MVCARTASAPLLAAALVAALAVACSLVSGAYAAAEQEAAGAGGNDLRLRQPPITRGLSFDFYKRSCPMAESIVRHFVRDAVRKDVGLAAGLLRKPPGLARLRLRCSLPPSLSAPPSTTASEHQQPPPSSTSCRAAGLHLRCSPLQPASACRGPPPPLLFSAGDGAWR